MLDVCTMQALLHPAFSLWKRSHLRFLHATTWPSRSAAVSHVPAASWASRAVPDSSKALRASFDSSTSGKDLPEVVPPLQTARKFVFTHVFCSQTAGSVRSSAMLGQVVPATDCWTSINTMFGQRRDQPVAAVPIAPCRARSLASAYETRLASCPVMGHAPAAEGPRGPQTVLVPLAHCHDKATTMPMRPVCNGAF